MFATDSAGTKVWEARYLPFGGVQASTGPNSDLRFPGQWFQAEAALHQNWMRDYDPTTGRYIQADPLGLVDGASVYGYVSQNPGRYTDPTGLCPWCWAGRAAVGGVVGVATGYALDADGCYTFDEFARDFAIGAIGGLWSPVAGSAATATAAAARKGTGEIPKWLAKQLENLRPYSNNVVPQVTRNRNAGNAFRDELAEGLRREGREVDTEKYFWTPFGKRFSDIQVSIQGRPVGLVETKLGNSPYTPAQRTKDFYIWAVHGLRTQVVRGP